MAIGVPWNKAALGGLVSPIFDWVLGLADNAILNATDQPVPAGVHAAVLAILVGLVVWAVPNNIRQ